MGLETLGYIGLEWGVVTADAEGLPSDLFEIAEMMHCESNQTILISVKE